MPGIIFGYFPKEQGTMVAIICFQKLFSLNDFRMMVVLLWYSIVGSFYSFLAKGSKWLKIQKVLKNSKTWKKKQTKKNPARYSYLLSFKVVFMVIFTFEHSFPNISSNITRLNFRIDFWGLWKESLTLLGGTW